MIRPGIIDLFFHYDIPWGFYLKYFLEKWNPLQKLSMCMTISYRDLKSTVI